MRLAITAVSALLCASVHTQARPTKRMSDGCGATGFYLDSSGHYERTLPSGRSYRLYVPSGYDKQSPAPLALSFHGASGTSKIQEDVSGLSTKDTRIAGSPVIAVYPQGAPSTDRGKSAAWYSAPYANTTVDDVQFAKDIIQDMSSHYCINPQRIYASGLSNGGGFTNYLACRPDTAALFAAFAPVSAALYPESLAFEGCNPGRAVPILNSHGVKDETIPFEGRGDAKTGKAGEGTSTVDIRQWRAAWAERNGCTRAENGSVIPNEVTRPYTGTTKEVWDCQATVQAYTVETLGHLWPKEDNAAEFDLTHSEMLDFFSASVLPLDAPLQTIQKCKRSHE